MPGPITAMVVVGTDEVGVVGRGRVSVVVVPRVTVRTVDHG
jgi:hypothetical protein